MEKYRIVGFDSLPIHSNKEERGINMANMEVKILVMEKLDETQKWQDIETNM